MLNLERQNLVAAKENHEIAMERYMLGNLSGIEMREAQKSLLDAEKEFFRREYNTKLCEISFVANQWKSNKIPGIKQIFPIRRIFSSTLPSVEL